MVTKINAVTKEDMTVFKIFDHRPRLASEIAERMGITTNKVISSLRRLKRAGLVDNEDMRNGRERIVIWSRTPQGAQLVMTARWASKREKEKSGHKPSMNNNSAEAQKNARIKRENELIVPVLKSIQRNPRKSTRDRAHELRVSDHTVRSVISRLEADGTIRRKEHSRRSMPEWEIADLVGAK